MGFSKTEKKTIVQEFRTRVSDLLKPRENLSEVFLIRWLEAKDYNLIKAEEMIRNTFKWREENNIDSLSNKKFDSYFSTNYPIMMKGVDRRKQPVMLSHFGKWDVKKAVQDGKGDELMDYILSNYENIINLSQKASMARKPDYSGCTGFVGLMDLDGYSYNQVLNMNVLKLCMKLTMVFEAHYTGSMFRLVLINCPRIFSMLWKIIKPLLSQINQDRIVIHGYNKSEWIPCIRELIDPSQIPIQFGGELNYCL